MNNLYLIVVVGLVVVYKLVSYLQAQSLKKKFNTSEPPYHIDGWWGFRQAWTFLVNKNAGTMIQYCLDMSLGENRDRTTYTARTHLAGNEVVVTFDPENIKAVLGTQFNDFSLGVRHPQLFPLLGDGIFTLDAAGWKHSRTMLRPQFAREQVAHVKSLEPHIQVLAKHVRNAKGSSFDLQELFFRLTVDSATEFLFGHSVESLRDSSVGYTKASDIPGKLEFADSFNDAQAFLATRVVFQKFYSLAQSFKFNRDCKNVHMFTDYYVDQVLAMSPEELEKKSAGGYTFLYELAKQTRDRKVLRDQSLNILLAGRDTTAGLLSFVWLELSRNPEVFKRLREEVTSNFGDGDDARVEEITFESLKKCEYLKAVLNEALRLYPSVPQNFRCAVKDTTLPTGGGPNRDKPILVKKGETIIYQVVAMHRLRTIYGKDADVFRPDRWFEESTRKLGWAFLPFNGGPRICLGQQFALTEASYVTVRLLQMFTKLKQFSDEYPPKLRSELTLSLFDGLNVSLE